VQVPCSRLYSPCSANQRFGHCCWSNHLVVGPLWSSRVSLRCVHTLRSTHHHWSWASPACLGGVAAATRAGGSWLSGFMVASLPPSCVPWLHARYALRRYYGRSDSCRAVLRAAAAMNTVLVPAGLPAYLAYASCHSVSNHPPVMPRLFARSLFSSARGHGPAGLLRLATVPFPSEKLGLRDGLRTGLAGSSHRLAESSSLWFVNTRIYVTDWQFTSGSSPPRVATTQ